ncbi:MAG: TIGR03086 family metal-binding protein [Acidimicrobiales bacterium]
MADRAVELFVESIGRFADRVDDIADDDWGNQTPCAEWGVRVLVNHVCNEQLWAPHLVAGETLDQVGDRYDGDVLGDDPKAAFRRAVEGSIAAFAGADLDGIVHLSFGDVPCRVYLEQMLTDAEVHGWDLAEGLGEPTELEPETASFLLPTMEAQADLIRSSGMFGDSVPVDDDADDATKLLALLGRDPR